MLEATFGPQGGLTEPQQLVVCWSSHMRPKHEILKNCPLHSSTVDSKKESWSSYAIRMQHWRRPATDGAEFWISCKRPVFLSSFSRLQVIQNKRPWCSAAAYVTAGYDMIRAIRFSFKNVLPNIYLIWAWNSTSDIAIFSNSLTKEQKIEHWDPAKVSKIWKSFQRQNRILLQWNW